MQKYERVILKLSGEALANVEERLILNNQKLQTVARAIKDLWEEDVEIGIVVGAGNIWRGAMANEIGIDPSTADYMGMLGTIINSLALQSALENLDVPTRVMSSIEVNAVCEPYIKRKALSHFEKKRVVIFAGGTGNPFFTTDSNAALKALDVNANVILMAKNGVKGVYDKDPRANKDAKLIKELTYNDYIKLGLRAMDQTAVSLLADSEIDIVVFSMDDPHNISKAASGENVGTRITKG